MGLGGFAQGLARGTAGIPNLIMAKKQMGLAERRLDMSGRELGMREKEHDFRLSSAEDEKMTADDARFAARMYPLLEGGHYDTASRYAMQDPERTNRLLGLGDGRSFAGFQAVTGPGGEEYVTAMVNNTKTGTTGPMTERASADGDDKVVYMPKKALRSMFAPYLPAQTAEKFSFHKGGTGDYIVGTKGSLRRLGGKGAETTEWHQGMQLDDGTLVQLPKKGGGKPRYIGEHKNRREIFDNLQGTHWAQHDFQGIEEERSAFANINESLALAFESNYGVDAGAAYPRIAIALRRADEDTKKALLKGDEATAMEAEKSIIGQVLPYFQQGGAEPAPDAGGASPPTGGGLRSLGAAHAAAPPQPMPSLGVTSEVPGGTSPEVLRNMRVAAENIMANTDLPTHVRTQVSALLDGGQFEEAQRVVAAAEPSAGGQRLAALLASLAEASRRAG